MFTSEDISKFIELNKRLLGRDITREEALEEGIKLIRLMKIIYKEMTKDEYKIVQKRRTEIETKKLK